MDPVSDLVAVRRRWKTGGVAGFAASLLLAGLICAAAWSRPGLMAPLVLLAPAFVLAAAFWDWPRCPSCGLRLPLRGVRCRGCGAGLAPAPTPERLEALRRELERRYRAQQNWMPWSKPLLGMAVYLGPPMLMGASLEASRDPWTSSLIGLAMGAVALLVAGHFLRSPWECPNCDSPLPWLRHRDDPNEPIWPHTCPICSVVYEHQAPHF
jgi:hypothetical protein